MILAGYNYITNCRDRYIDKLPGVDLSRDLISQDVQLSHQINKMQAVEVNGKENVDRVFLQFLLRDAEVNMTVRKLALSSDKSQMFLIASGNMTERESRYKYNEVSMFTFRKLPDGTSEISKISTTVISSLFNS